MTTELVVGWIISFLVGGITAYLAHRFSRKNKVIAWGVLSETQVIAEDISRKLDVPVQLSVGGSLQENLTAIVVRVANIGNDVVKDFDIVIKFNSGCATLIAPIGLDLGEFDQHLKISVRSEASRFHFDFLNCGETADIQFLLTDYVSSSCQAGMAAPGVRFMRSDPRSFDLSTRTLGGFLRSLSFGFAGARYEPGVSINREIVDELRALRKSFEKNKDRS